MGKQNLRKYSNLIISTIAFNQIEQKCFLLKLNGNCKLRHNCKAKKCTNYSLPGYSIYLVYEGMSWSVRVNEL